MGKNLEPKCKQCRRVGEKLMLKGERCMTAKCGMVKRNFVPGFHGPKGPRKRLSDYGLQLAEKQKAKKFYNMLEKQFRLTFEKAQARTGDAGKNFLQALEMRLDNVVYRLSFADSRSQARQVVNHGHITVNGKKVDIPSYVVKTGDVVAVRKQSANSRYFRTVFEKKNVELPSWLNIVDKVAKVLHEPNDKDLPQNFSVQMIIEYYSK
ncbi:MAG: 30S ribosomal protein S4 [Patescibacteria group bacterium]